MHQSVPEGKHEQFEKAWEIRFLQCRKREGSCLSNRQGFPLSVTQ